ncbi:unnamed protein product [Linum trigynum]|uniref:Uncharacterized protein n=1 Tax=Linum trigynum TaxID=586398 RepID=A0AAV2FS86_9ROSI
MSDEVMENPQSWWQPANKNRHIRATCWFYREVLILSGHNEVLLPEFRGMSNVKPLRWKAKDSIDGPYWDGQEMTINNGREASGANSLTSKIGVEVLDFTRASWMEGLAKEVITSQSFYKRYNIELIEVKIVWIELSYVMQPSVFKVLKVAMVVYYHRLMEDVAWIGMNQPIKAKGSWQVVTHFGWFVFLFLEGDLFVAAKSEAKRKGGRFK